VEDAAGRFEFALRTPDGERSYVVAIAAGNCEISRGPVDDTTCTIRLDLADFLRMSTGETNGAILAMSASLRSPGISSPR
jgi:putative sterol carrier protein